MTQIRKLLNKNIDTYVVDVERELMLAMMKNMGELSTNISRAQELARIFLKLYPYSDKEIVLRVLKEMGEKYPEAHEVYIKCAEKYYQEKVFHTTKKAHSHIAKGEIDKAVKTVKGGNTYV